ncbi:MAG: HAD-IA family hydrolase [Anaplasmataceae bacterium]|nr:HAD-IA family hydrolase [Anaplasmataceae bacterium]
MGTNNSQINGKISQLKEEILEGVKVISFDVFDTLVVRPFLKPVDVFAFISPEVEKIIGRPIDFRHERMKAEYETRVALPQYQDITIDEIYSHFTVLPQKHRDEVKQLELKAEKKFIYAKKSGRELYVEAKASGCRLVAISDMYLGEDFIRDILLSLGYSFEEVYVSSRRREVKYNGSMFRYVVRDLGIQPSNLLHIGDSEQYDIAPASHCGAKTLKVEKNSDVFFENKANNFLWSYSDRNNVFLSATLGLVANKLFDKSSAGFSYDEQSVFNGDPYNIGYYWLGPLLTAFSMELASFSTSKKYIYFLSRDGWIMRKIYDIVASHLKHAPPSKYLYVSRKSTALAPIRSLDNMWGKFGVAWDQTTIREWFEDRIGIPIEKGDEELVTEAGFSQGLESKINLKNSYRFNQVLKVISPRILAKAKEERLILLAYLSQEGVIDMNKGHDYRIGFVDIGYHGQTARNIFQLTENHNIDLYFLVAGKEIFGLADEFGIDIRGFYGETCRGTRVLDRYWKKFFRHHKIFETFFITDEESVKSYSYGLDGKVIPVFYDKRSGKEQQVARNVHRGAMDFADDWSRIFNEDMLKFSPIFNSNALMRPFLFFANYTNPKDAHVLDGAFFEDYFSGLSLQKVEWFGGWLAKKYPRLCRLRTRAYFIFWKVYSIPTFGAVYDWAYWLALRVYRRVRRIFRFLFIFKNFIHRIF